jgi:hypothetical protein
MILRANITRTMEGRQMKREKSEFDYLLACCFSTFMISIARETGTDRQFKRDCV